MRDSLNRKQFKKKRKQPNKTKTKTNKKQPKGIKQIHENLIDHLILLCDNTNKVKFHANYLYCQNENVILFH